MGLSITILESAHLGVTIVEPFNVSFVPTPPATIEIEVGVPGASASVTVGTTTTLDPGLNATVTNVGTATNAILDFGIPRGEQGIQGIQGIQGPAGTSGVVYATAPLSYNAGTQTISIDLSAYATQSFVTSQGYITISALTPYLTSATAAATYYPLTNPAGYITVADLTGYATESWVTSQGYLTDAPSDGETYARKNAAWEVIGGGSYLPLAGGTMDADATIVLSTSNYDSLVSGEVFGVELTADPAQNASLSFNAVTVQDGVGSMQMRADGLTFPDATTQITAFPGFSGYATESFVTSQGYITDAPSDTYGYVRKAGAWSYSPKFYEVQVGAWTNLSSGQYLIADGSFVTNITAADIILSTAAGVGMRLTDASITFADATVQSTAGLSPATAAITYAPIAAAVPVGGSTGQVLTKTSGTDYALSWETPVVGDRYLTSSTTSNTVSNGNKTFTIGTGLSYTPTQNITISYNASNHMHGEVLTYNSGTGVLTVDINHHTGSGTYTSWVVNVGGVTPATSVAWGSITGTLSAQTDLQTALNAKAPLASPTFTGDPRSVTPATSDNDTSIATTAFVKNQSYITASALTGYALQNGTSAFSVTSNTIRSLNSTDDFVQLNQTALEFGNLGVGVAGLSVSSTGITFADSTVQTTAAVAGVPEAPIDGTTYGRLNGTWTAVGGSGLGTVTYSSPYLYDTVGSANISTIDLGSGSLTANQVFAGNVTLDSTGVLLAPSSGAVITFPDTTTQSTAPHDIPFGGATGEVLTKNSATDYDVSWVAPSGGSGGVDIQTFGSSTTSGTFSGASGWQKPAGAKWVEVYLVGGGPGGGSGARQATSSIRGGGSAGAGGNAFYGRIAADYLGSTETVTVGNGGSGGASVTTDSTNGNNGSLGGASSFSIYRTATSTVNGKGGTSTAGGATSTGSYIYSNGYYVLAGQGGAGATAIGSDGSGYFGLSFVPTGGGGGAGATAGVTTSNRGGQGGPLISSTNYAGLASNIAGGASGTTGGVPATAGTSATTQYFIAGTGGGGGFYINGTAGGNGGAGGWPGGGGGGGGASNNGFASGAGGAGGNGFALIITYC